MKQKLVTTPILLSLILLAGTFALPPSIIDRAGTYVGQRILNRYAGPEYQISVTGVSGPLYRELRVQEIAVVSTADTAPIRDISVRNLHITYNLVTLLSKDPLKGLKSLRTEGAFLSLSPGDPVETTETTQSPEQDEVHQPKTVDSSPIEEATLSLPAHLPPEAELYLPLTITGLTLPGFVAAPTTDTSATVTATVSAEYAQQRLVVTASLLDYSVTVTVNPPFQKAHIAVSGPGAEGNLELTGSGFTAGGTVRPGRLPMEPFFGTATFTAAATYAAPGLPVSSFISAIQRIPQGISPDAEGTVVLSAISTPFGLVLSEGYLTYRIRDSIAHVSAAIDGDPTGRISMENVVIPLQDIGAFHPGEIRIIIPEDAPFPAALVPQNVATLLVQSDVVRRANGGEPATGGDPPDTLLLPEIDVTIRGIADGGLSLAGQLARSGVGTVNFQAELDPSGRFVSLRHSEVSWSKNDWLLEGIVQGQAHWDALYDATATVHISARHKDAPDRIHSLDADYAHQTVTIHRLNAAAGGISLSLIEPATVRSQNGGVAVEHALLAVAEGTVAIEGTFNRSHFNAGVTIDRLALNQLVETDTDTPENTLSGYVSGSLSASGPYDEPQFTAAMKTESLTVHGEPGMAALVLSQDDRGIQVTRGEVQVGTFAQGQFTGRLPFAVDSGGLRFIGLENASFNGRFSSARFDRMFEGDQDSPFPRGNFTAQILLPEGADRIRLTTEFVFSPAGESENGVGRFGFGYDKIAATVEITSPRKDSLKSTFSISTDDTRMFRGSGEIVFPGMAWNLYGDGDIPLEFIARYIPGVTALTGVLNTTVTGSGTRESLFLDGSASLVGVEIRPAGSLPDIARLEGTIHFNHTGYSAESLQGELGLSPFSITLTGTFPDGDSPGTMEARLTGDNLLLLSTPVLRARGDAEILLTGRSGTDLVLGGTLNVRSATYSRDISLTDMDSLPAIDTEMTQLFSLPGPVGRAIRLDLRVLSSRTIRIENNLYNGSFSADMTLRGTLEVPLPQGRIYADQGRLTLPLTVIHMENVVLRFPQDRPFLPDIQIRGIARLRNYQLVIFASGILPEIEIDITSTPPLSQSDALVLLTTGFIPADLTGSGDRVALAIGSRLGTQFVRSFLGSSGSAEGAEFADRVDVILGEGVTESGAETIEIEFRLSEGESWYLVFRRDRYDRYNMDLAWRFWID